MYYIVIHIMRSVKRFYTILCFKGETFASPLTLDIYALLVIVSVTVYSVFAVFAFVRLIDFAVYPLLVTLAVAAVFCPTSKA